MKLIWGAGEAESQIQTYTKGPHQVEKWIATGRFQPERGQIKALETEQGLQILVGKPETAGVRAIQQQLGRAVRLAQAERVRSVEIDLDNWPTELSSEELVRAAALAAWEGSYSFCRRHAKVESGLEQIYLKKSEADPAALSCAFQEGDRLGRAVTAVRDAVNRTSRDMNPKAFADWVLAQAEGLPCEIEILDKKSLEEAGVKALLHVSAGAEHSPYLAVLRYRGDPEHPEEITAVLGKGVTFDSGGLSLKSKKGMITMHHDMAGAAAAAAAVVEVARAKLSLNLTAVLPLCENMLSPASYRPGDIIETMDGKTVLIKSTDAEGRLILADAMTWAICKEGAKRLIDIATLTGGAVAAYGPLINAVAGEDPVLMEGIQAASQTSGELVWKMPLLAEYKSYLSTEHADLANSSNGAGSAMINAALFLKEFTQSRPWLHIDSAGTSWAEKTDGCQAFGATGAGTVLLFDLFRQLADSENRIKK